MTRRPPLLPYEFFAADPPELPVRGPDDPGGPDEVIRAELDRKEDQGLRLVGRTRTGASMKILVRMAAPGIVRVLLKGRKERAPRITLARDLSRRPVRVKVKGRPGGYTLFSRGMAVEIDLNPFRLTFRGPGGGKLLEQNRTDRDAVDRLLVLPFGFTRMAGRNVAFHDAFTAAPDEHYYGFGEQFTALDKRGQYVEMWNYDAYGVHGERAHKCVPFFMSSKGYGLFVDTTTMARFDMAHSNHGAVNLVVPDRALDYYVLAGPELKTVLRRYALLTGLPRVPPKWAFGLWVSSGFQEDHARAALRRARTLRERKIPCDVLHLDCYWQRFGSWSDLEWDREAFPDPEGLIRKLKGMGYKISLWMNPYLSVESERFQEARSKGYLLKDRKGRACALALWGSFHPPVGIVDLTHPEGASWFKDRLRPLFRMGVDVLKTDFGEGVPVEAVARNGISGDALHNLYPLLYHDAVFEVTREETRTPAMVWARSSWSGGQRHPGHWAGDPSCTWPSLASTLRGGLSLSMSGHAFWSHDMGGFHGEPTPDLFLRWSQFGLLSPLSRAHGRTPRLPWGYGKEVLRIFRRFTRLRYRLAPYLYTYAMRAGRTGLPMLRAMVLEFPEDPCTHTLDLQYLLGEALMVAPLYDESGRRPVYFPQGRWIDFFSLETIEGPATRTVTAPRSRVPLYVRADALIPFTAPSQRLGHRPFQSLTFDAYLFTGARFTVEDLDGCTTVEAAMKGSRLDLRIQGPRKRTVFRLRPLTGHPRLRTVAVNGKTLKGAGWKRLADGTIRVPLNRH